MTAALWRWSACELASAIRAGQIRSREAVESCLTRLREVNPQINAVVDVLHDEALADAERADAATMRHDPLGPLHGVPVTIKINVDCAGRATTNGVAAFKDRIASADSPPVANWRKAGAIIIGRTNVPAFSARFFTDKCALWPNGQSVGAALHARRLERGRGRCGGDRNRCARAWQ